MKPPLDTIVVLGSILLAVSVQADEVVLHDKTVIHFASEAEGQETLAAQDRFLTALSPFDRQSRVETDQDVNEAAFVDFLRSHVRSWTDAERTKLTAMIESLRPKLAGLRLRFPESVWLVKTTGGEEGDAAYCRRHAVVLPQSKINDTPRELERLLVHELFHILSSHDPEFRASCYKLIGFRVVAPIELPDSLRDRKITNPDGPLSDALIDIMVEGESRSVVPVLYSSERRFDPVRGGPFFKYLTFRLLVAERHEGGWRAAMRNGEPWMLVPGQTADFGRQIGATTGYIIHPDEILADNFVHLVYQTPNLRSPQIVANLREALQGPR